MNFLASSLVIAGATFASRLLGLARDVLFARAFGASLTADAFIVAFRLPNLFRRLFAEGAFSAGFVPIYTRLAEREARAFAGKLLALSALAMAAVCFAAEIFMEDLVFLLAGGFADNPAKLAQTVFYARLMFPYLAAMTLVSLYGALLHAHRRFLAAASMPLVLNLFFIAALLLAQNTPALNGGALLSLAVAAAGAAQCLLAAFAAGRAGLVVLPSLADFSGLLADAGVKRFLRLFLPLLASGGVIQLNILVGTRIASSEPAAVSWLYYAERLYQLPLALIGIAIGAALLPDLTRHYQAGRSAEGRAALGQAVNFAMLAALPAAAGLAVLALPVITALFAYGAFSLNDSSMSANALAAFAFGLPAFVLIKIFAAACYAREQIRPIFLFTLLALAANVSFALWLFPLMSAAGVALATSLAAWLQAGCLFVYLTRLGAFPPLAALARQIAAQTFAAALMAAALGGLSFFWPLAGVEHIWLWRLAQLMLAIAAGFALYAALCHIFAIATLSSLRRALSAK